MSIQTLKSQFQKELKTNPKKAVVLGLLALVAVYFWVPLAMKLVSGNKPNSNTSTVAPTENQGEAASTISQPQSSSQAETTAQQDSVVVTFSWEQIQEWIAQDPLTTSYPALKNTYDPFKRVEKVIEVPESDGPLANQETEPEPEVVRDLSPEALGMKLTSTIVGQQRSVAMIDERAYSVGQRVLTYDGTTPLKFRLVEIRPESVILERDEQQYALKISQTIGLMVEDADAEGL